MTTCFMAISGGINWQLVYVPLNDLDPVMGVIFILYISFTYFALLNILTGVFCNSAMEALSRDPDIVAISKDATNMRNQLPKAQLHVNVFLSLSCLWVLPCRGSAAGELSEAKPVLLH